MRFDQLGGPLALVVLVVGDERRLHAVALEQHARAARVLARDDVGVAQRRQHAQRDVLEVADRRRADDEAPAHAADLHAMFAKRTRKGTAPRPRAGTPLASRRPRARQRRADHARLGAERRRARSAPRRAPGASARSRTISPRGLEQQLARRDHAAADHDDLRVEDVHERGEADAERARRSRSIASRATGSPSRASSVTSGPVSARPSSSAWPSAVSGRRATRSDASRTSAVPEHERLQAAAVGAVALAGRAVDVDRPCGPSSAPPPIQPR